VTVFAQMLWLIGEKNMREKMGKEIEPEILSQKRFMKNQTVGGHTTAAYLKQSLTLS